jgi:hypothetical protein
MNYVSDDGHVRVAPVPRYAVQSLSLGLVATLLSAVLGAAFFSVGGVFGPLSDLAALATGVALLPLVWALSVRDRSVTPRWSRAGVAVGSAGFGLVALGSAGLLVTDIGLVSGFGVPALAVQFLGYGLVGVWLLLLGGVALRTGRLPRRVAWAGIVGGLGYASFPVGTVTVGFGAPILYLGMGAALAGFTLWAVWLWTFLRSVPTDDGTPGVSPA